eukprot:jgi/Astpho2/321/Aster-02203
MPNKHTEHYAVSSAQHSAAANGVERHSSQPFLTEQQRAALDAALAAKQSAPEPAEDLPRTASKDLTRAGSSGLSAVPRSPVKALKSRPSTELKGRTSQQSKKGQGKVKKGGAGGKFTWGNMMTDQETQLQGSLDKNDPNYDSEEDKTVSYHSQKTLQIKLYKKAVVALLEEYFNSGDVEEATSTLQELEEPDFHHYFVKKTCTLAMDKHGREREMASHLLSALYTEVISDEQVQKGFAEVVLSVEDLQLDVPDAVDETAAFVARAVVDDVLPPSFVRRLPTIDGAVATQVKQKAEAHLSARHAGERLMRVWGGQAGLLHSETKQSISNMLQEYLVSKDIAEVRRCLHSLAMPFFHHEAVKQALLMALDDPAKQGPVLQMLGQLADSSDISGSQMLRGFQRVSDNLGDTCLDTPNADEHFATLVAAAKEQGWLDSSFAAAGKTAFKASAIAAIREYFDSSDAAEVGRSLGDLEEPGLTNIFVKQAVQLAMDRKDRERELTSALLAALSPQTISEDQMSLGFTRLLASVEDLALDIPDAPHLLALFLGRAVVDEVLAPSFLASVLPALRNDSLGVTVVQTTGSMLSARHAAERLINCWHGGCQTVDQLRESMQASHLGVIDAGQARSCAADKALLEEYLGSGDTAEAARCLHDLTVPFYHHELVKRALLMALDPTGHHAASLFSLLAKLAASGEVNQTQMRKGFSRVEASLDDVVLDLPKAREDLAKLKQQALKEGWLVAES